MDKDLNQQLAGRMMIGLIIIGFLGIFAAIFAWLNAFDYVGVGLCLFAAAYAFSGVLKAYR